MAKYCRKKVNAFAVPDPLLLLTTAGNYTIIFPVKEGKFMELIIGVLKDALSDTLKMLPFLFGVYLLIEYLEHKASDRLPAALRKMGAFGPIGGAALGCLPQCGFSVAASNLYSGRLISLGTLVAVFVATSDEALPILISHPDGGGKIFGLILAKLLIASASGLLIDLILRIVKGHRNEDEEPYKDLCEDCGCDEHGVVYSALMHTVKITAFVFVISLGLGLCMAFLGEETLGRIIMSDSPLQPFLTALIGLIPNCAPSVILTDLYAAGKISFGAVVSGLSTGAGLGLVVLFRTNKSLKENIMIAGILYFIGVFAGEILQIFC